MNYRLLGLVFCMVGGMLHGTEYKPLQLRNKSGKEVSYIMESQFVDGRSRNKEIAKGTLSAAESIDLQRPRDSRVVHFLTMNYAGAPQSGGKTFKLTNSGVLFSLDSLDIVEDVVGRPVIEQLIEDKAYLKSAPSSISAGSAGSAAGSQVERKAEVAKEAMPKVPGGVTTEARLQKVLQELDAAKAEIKRLRAELDKKAS